MAAVLKKRALAEYSQTIQQSTSQPLVKKIKIVKKYASDTTLGILSSLDNSKTSNDALQILLLLSDNLDLETAEIPEALKKLFEHYKKEAESTVRVKILAVICEIGQERNADLTLIIEECIAIIKAESSHKVIAQGLNTMLKLAKVSKDVQLHQKIMELAKFYLKDTNHAVKCKCLEILGILIPVNMKEEARNVLDLIYTYCNSDDARVRSQAFENIILLHNRGVPLKPEIYEDVCKALKDDYEIVRQAALKLVCILGKTYAENIIVIPDSEEEIRLIDDAFGKVCNSVCDLSMNVRTLASKLLGSMKEVSSKFLNQTLDKKLMSNMRRKRTAHELAWENLTSGEWSSGKKWADDAPKELLDADRINLMSSGACGAFVHGLEDEFLEVRSAAVESMCQLSINNPEFAVLSLDFLVDMFNDEIEDVRLKAIDSLRCISMHIILRDDQLETILSALDDCSQEVREGLHRMLASCKISTMVGLKMCVDKLLDNLKRYPQDRRSLYKCLQKVGGQHPELVLPLVPQLLGIHPFFDMAEPDVDNPQYICVLLLVLNAAKFSPTIIPLFEPHTLRHYAYLRDTIPNLVPELNLSEFNNNDVAKPINVSESIAFLKNIISNIDCAGKSYRIQMNLLQLAKEHLLRLSEIDATVSGTSQFTALFIGAQLLMTQILCNGWCMNPSTLATQQINNLKTNIKQLLENCLKLQFLFVGLGSSEICAIKELRLRALALNLIYIVKGTSSSALAACHHFLCAVDEVRNDLSLANLKADDFTNAVVKELCALEEPKPGTVARLLIPILEETKLGKIPQPNVNIRMTSATILEPSGQTDSALKFTAGLIMAVPFEAELNYLVDPNRLRLKVKYPDQKTQIILPRPSHLKPLLYDTNNLDDRVGHNLRLLTTILISHQVWSEACNVEINIALAIPEADIGKRKTSADSVPSLLDLCKPVKVSVAPKPIKRTL